MSLDSTLLKLLRDKDKYELFHRAVPQDILAPHTRIILKDYGDYYKETQAPSADADTFKAWFDLKHPKLQAEARGVLHKMIQAAQEPVPASVEAGILMRLEDARQAAKLTTLLEKYQAGEEVSVTQSVLALADSTPVSAEELPKVRGTVEQAMDESENDWGFHWRLDCLNQSMRPLQPGDFIIAAARVDQGKCLAVGTLVIMADGTTKKVEDVQVGDVLAGPYRNNTVTGTTRGRSEMFEVTYPWGESYTVNHGHLLSLARSANEGKNKAGELRTIQVQEYNPPNAKNYRWKGWKAGISLPETPLPMDAYALGLWLGDGTSAKPQLTTQDAELLEYMVNLYGEYSNCWNGITYDFYRSAMLTDLRAAGVLGNKHIPAAYLRAGDDQRRALLAGLLDTDGYNTGCGYEFSQKDEAFMQDFVFLVRSLGFHCTYSREWKRATNSNHEGDWYYRARIGTEVYGALPIKRLAHLTKEAKWAGKPKRNGNRHSITVTSVGEGDYAGFGLDGDHLFLLGDFTVTHNTTFYVSELSFMAGQVDRLFPGQDRPIVILNNESLGIRVKTRLVQATLNHSMEELVAARRKGQDVYAEAMKEWGGRNLIEVYDVHDRPLSFLENIVRRRNPAIVVLDMIDNVPFDGSVGNGGTRTDQILEASYQRARIWAVKYNCVVIAMSQLSATAAGALYPGLHELSNSKTGKAGAADAIVMLGHSDDPVFSTSRWISLPKNKLTRQGGAKDPRAEVIFDGSRARFNNPEVLP